MAKGGWAKRFKSLFGGSSEAPDSKDKKKDGETWEKDGDGEIVWAFFDVHKEEQEAEQASEVKEEESDDTLLEELIVQEEEEVLSEEDEGMEEDAEEIDSKPRILDDSYLADEVIYYEEEDLSKAIDEKKPLSAEERLDNELSKSLDLLEPSEDYLKSIKIAYLRYLKNKYPFQDFRFLEKEFELEEEMEAVSEEADLGPSAFEKAFMEVDDTGGGQEIKTEGYTFGEAGGEGTWDDYSSKTTAFLSVKDDSSEKEEDAEGEGTQPLWGGQSKYDDFFAEQDKATTYRSLEEEEESVEDKEEDDNKSRLKKSFQKIASQVAKSGPVSLEAPVAVKDPLEEELSEEDKALDPDQLVEKANNEMELGWKDKSVRLLSKAALLYKLNKQYEKSFDVYERLHKLDTTNVKFIYALGFISKEMGRVEEAKIYFRNVLRIELTHKDTLFQLGLISFEEETYDTAAIAFRKVLSIDSCHMEAYLKLGELFEKDNIDEAIKNYLAGADNFINSQEIDGAVFLLGKILKLDKENKEARKKLEELGLDPDASLEVDFLSEEEKKDAVQHQVIEPAGLDTIEELSEETPSFLEVEENNLTSVDDHKDEETSEDFELDEGEETWFQNDESSSEFQESDESKVSKSFEKEVIKKTMKLKINTDCNMEDFLEEISLDYTLDPSLAKILEQNVDLMFTDGYYSQESLSPIVFSSFVEDCVDEFSLPVPEIKNPGIIDTLYPSNYSEYLKGLSEKTIENIKDRFSTWKDRFSVKPPKETAELENSINFEEKVEDFEPIDELGEAITEDFEHDLEETLSGVSSYVDDLVYEPSTEEFLECFVPGELKPYSEEVMGIGLGVSIYEEEPEEDEQEEEEELDLVEDEDIAEEKEEEVKDVEEVKETEEKVEEVEEIIEEVREVEEVKEEEEKAEEVEEVEEKAEEVKAEEKAEEVKAEEKAEEVKAEEKAEEVKAEEKAEEVKAEEKAEEVKAEEKAEEVKAEEKAEEEKAEEVKAEEKAEEVKAEEKAEEVKAEEKAEENVETVACSEASISEVDKEIEHCRELLKKDFQKLDKVIDIYRKLQNKYPSYVPLCCATGSVYIKKGLFVEGLKEYIKTLNTSALEGKDNLLKRV